MRVVLDSNVIISTFLSPTGAPARVFHHWQRQSFEPVVSEPLLQEYQRALEYERVAARHRMTPAQVAEVIAELRQFAIVVAPPEPLSVISEDPDDNKVLECALAGEAEFLVSGDLRHLLRLEEYQGIQILSPAAFLTLLEQEGS